MATYHVEPPEHWEPVPKVYRETFSKEFLADHELQPNPLDALTGHNEREAFVPEPLPDRIVDEETDIPSGCTCHWEKRSSFGNDYWTIITEDATCTVHATRTNFQRFADAVANALNPEREVFAERVNNYLADLGELLIAKNAAYGNSALDPIRVFSTASPVEQLKVRIDDKISRIAKGHDYANEDTLTDIAGYIVLLALATEDADD